MTDHFKREIKTYDLVCSKATGRYSHMVHGIQLESGSVYFAKGGIGGAGDRVIINTENDPELETIRKEIIEQYEKYEAGKKASAEKKKKTRLKKAELKRFSVYDGEIYLGSCKYDGEVHENVWVKYYKHYSDTHWSKVLGDSYIRLLEKYNTWSYRSSDRFEFVRDYSLRDVKYPQKFKEEYVFTKEEVLNMLESLWSITDNNKDWSYKDTSDKRWLEIM